MTKKYNTNLKGVIRRVLNEQIFGGYECETSTCNCVNAGLSWGYYQPNSPVAGLTAEENCWNDYGNAMPPGSGQINNCNKVACKPGQGCINIPYTDPDWSTNCVAAGTCFEGCNAMNDCQAANPNGCDPLDDYECIQGPAAGLICVVQAGGSFTGPNAQTDCQTAVSNNVAPCNVTTDAYSCDPQTCTCYVDPSGSMTLAACQAALLNPNSECYCNREDRWKCVKYYSPKHGREICDCQQDPNGPFSNKNLCEQALLNPQHKCYCGEGQGGWECNPKNGQCYDSGIGPHANKAACEATIDDHFNFGQGCDCQCQGCNGNINAGCAPATCTTPLNSPIPNDDPALGAIGSILDLQQLLSSAFKQRMAPCVPHQGSGVIHDCKFWKFISEVKMPQTRMDYVLNHPTSTNQFPLSSQTAHPRWQRKIEAKVAYLRCLRQECCTNTQWADTAYAGGYTHTLTDANTGQSYGAGWWTDSAGVWQPPL